MPPPASQLPVGSAVQQEAMQCYYLQFQPQDHSFLLQSNVFSNISKALSLPEDSQAEGSRGLRDKVQSAPVNSIAILHAPLYVTLCLVAGCLVFSRKWKRV